MCKYSLTTTLFNSTLGHTTVSTGPPADIGPPTEDEEQRSLDDFSPNYPNYPQIGLNEDDNDF